MKVKIWFAIILALGIAFSAWSQQSAPPKPAAAAPTLAVAMQVIQKELNAEGMLTYMAYISNADEKGSSQVMVLDSNVVADAASCTIKYHWWRSMHGTVVNDEDISLNLRDVKGVWTMSSVEAFNKASEKEGTVDEVRKYGYYERFVPLLYVVDLRMSNDDEEGFEFIDQEQAQRVGKAMAQAVKLCGGTMEPY